MQSGLYECQVMHARLSPQRHRFVYRIFLFALDLDELADTARRVRFFSRERPNLYSFRDADFLPLPGVSGDLKNRVHSFAKLHGVDLTGGRVLLVTLPRVFGYLFNPVSFYFCFDRTGAARATIAEVTNTFREVKPYFLGPDALRAHTESEASTSSSSRPPARFHLRVPKYFYVSPFSDVDVAFDFSLQVPDDKLSIQIDDYTGRERTLTSALTGTRGELTSARLAWFTLKYPLITLRVISLIHWHALLLWLKRVPWFAKSARAADQRDLYRPHASLASTTARPLSRPSASPGGSLQPSDVL
jgi:DUF1365 family protein